MTALMVRMLGLWVLVMGGAIATPAAAQSPPIEQQLNIRRHQFDRAQALQKAERLMELADRQLDRGQEEAAIAAWRQALELYSSVSDRPGILQAIAPLARTLIATEQYPEAEIVLHQQLANAQALGDRATQIYALNNLGVVYLQTGQNDRAEGAIATALEIAESMGDPAAIGLSWSNLGQLARLSGDWQSARNYYESAVAYRAEAADQVGFANSANRLAEVYRYFGDDDEAVDIYLAAREAALTANHMPTLLTTLDGLIGIYADRGDVDAVGPYVSERAVLTPDLPSPEQELGLYIAFGRYYNLLEDYPRSLAAFDKALAIAEQLEAYPQRTFILTQLEGLALLTKEN